MLLLFEHLAVAFAAVTGALAARGKRVDLFGVIVLALVTAVGGGTLRDLVLGRLPVFWVRDPNFIVTAVFSALAAFAWLRSGRLPQGALLVADALGLALVTIIGVTRSLDAGAPPVAAATLGVVTGVAGGIMRDVLTGEIPMVFRPEIYLYATAAACGAALTAALSVWAPESALAVPVGSAVVLGLRLSALRWRIRLPLFDAPDVTSLETGPSRTNPQIAQITQICGTRVEP